MGVRITDLETVALYDSVTETAFGPVFEREEEADAFLEWHLIDHNGDDPREIQPEHLIELVDLFRAERGSAS